MPNIGYQDISGYGFIALPSLVTVTEILTHVTSIGTAHVFGSEALSRVQHVGLIGLSYLNDNDGIEDVIWWSWLNFTREDIKTNAWNATHRLFYRLELGVVVRINAWY